MTLNTPQVRSDAHRLIRVADATRNRFGLPAVFNLLACLFERVSYIVDLLHLL